MGCIVSPANSAVKTETFEDTLKDAEMLRDFQEKLFNKWILEFLGAPKDKIMQDLKIYLTKPLKLKEKRCIFEALMKSPKLPLGYNGNHTNYVILKISDLSADYQMENELKFLKILVLVYLWWYMKVKYP